MISAPEFVRMRDMGQPPNASFIQRLRAPFCTHLEAHGPLERLHEEDWNSIQRAMALASSVVVAIHFPTVRGYDENHALRLLAQAITDHFEPLREVGVIARCSYGVNGSLGQPCMIVTLYGPYELDAEYRAALFRIECKAFSCIHEMLVFGTRVTH